MPPVIVVPALAVILITLAMLVEILTPADITVYTVKGKPTFYIRHK